MNISEFDNDLRLIDVELSVFFDGIDCKPLIINKDNYLVSCTLLEELSSDSSTIVGEISSNELELELYNVDDIFTPTNNNSIYYNKIKIGVPITIKIREELSNSEWINLGTFYVSDWISKQGSSIVNVLCYDKMSFILTKKIPSLLMKKNVSVRSFLSELLLKVGLTSSEFNIDTLLDGHMMQYAYVTGDTIGSVLSEIVKAHLCYVYINREGILTIIRVDSLVKSSEGILTDDNQILDVDVKHSILKQYEGVNVFYNEYSVDINQQINTSSEVSISSGETKLDTFVSNKPIYRLTNCTCTSADVISINDITYSVSDVTLTLYNKAISNKYVTLNIYGDVLVNASKQCNSIYLDDITVSDKVISIDSIYLSDKNTSEVIKNILYTYISNNNNPHISLEVRGNPNFKPGSVVTVTDYTNNITGDYIIISQQLIIEDGLQCKMECISVDRLRGDVIG